MFAFRSKLEVDGGAHIVCDTMTIDHGESATDSVIQMLGYQDSDLSDMFGHNDATADTIDPSEALEYLASLKG